MLMQQIIQFYFNFFFNQKISFNFNNFHFFFNNFFLYINNNNPIHWAAISGNPQTLAFLLDNNATIFPNFFSPLLLAARYGRLPCVAVLVESGIDINAVDQAGRTALHLAAWFGHNEIVKLLISKGADVERLDNLDRSALHIASWFGNLSSVEALLEKSKSQINLQDKSGNTALHLACQNNHKDVVSTLLRQGANTKIKNLIGQTVLNIAEADDKPEILEILQQKEGETTSSQGLFVDKMLIHDINKMNSKLEELASSHDKNLQAITDLREKIDHQGQILLMMHTMTNDMKRQVAELNTIANQITALINELHPRKSRFNVTHINK